MRIRKVTSLIEFVGLLFLALTYGCSHQPPTKTEYGKALLLTAKRDGRDLKIELTLPPKADGYLESHWVSVAPVGEKIDFSRMLHQETSRLQETSNVRFIQTELTDREQSKPLEVEVQFFVYRHEGMHRDKELFCDVKTVTVPLAEGR